VRGYQLRHLGICNEKNYLFDAGAAAPEFAGFAAELPADVFDGAVPGAGIVSVIGAAVLPEFGATTVFPIGAVNVVPSSEVGAGVASVVAGASGLLCRTDRPPVMLGMEINNAEIINTAAAPIVNFDKTVAVPRGPKAELETLLVNNAPASVFPGCSNTAATKTMQEIKKIE
jgi:hypothetical protein